MNTSIYNNIILRVSTISKKRVLFLFVLLGFYNVLNAQNLVPDSSFENYSSCPDHIGDFNKLKDWKSPTKGTPDYFNKCTEKGRYYVTNYNSSDIIVFPNSGNGLASIAIRANNADAYREYIQAKLLKKLEKNKRYLFSIYVWTDDVFYPDRLGALFSIDPISDYTNYCLNSKNALSLNIDSNLIKDNRKYLKISQVFLAKGGESYITIGHFSNETKYFMLKPSIYNSVYTSLYLDDVSVVEVNDCDIIRNFEIGKSLSLNSIYFEKNKSNILAESTNILNAMVEVLNNNSNIKIEIYGHTDNVGTPSFNMKLSLNRAEAIADYLISKNINKARIKCKGFGDSQPISKNDTEENKAKNRRVEIIFTK